MRLWASTPADRAAANVTTFLDWLERDGGRRFAGYDELWRWSVEELEAFWDAVWRFYGVRSATPHRAVLTSRAMPGAEWFPGASLNYAEAIFARATDARPAIVAVSEDGVRTELSWAALEGATGALAAQLRDRGVGRGDRVAGYLPNVPEAVVALLATASLGAVWVSCAPDFGARSVVDRFAQVQPKVLIAVDGYRFAGADHDRRAVVAELEAALPSRVDTLRPRFADLAAAPQPLAFATVPFDHPLWVLFSSGTTGLPKGIVHGHGGILLEHLKALGLCLDLRAGDRYLFHSSTSWMAWNFLVGGLLHGATIVLYDGSPAHPAVDRLWTLADETGANVLGLGSAYATACARGGVALPPLADLRVVIPTGAPVPPATWRWLGDALPPAARIDSICGGTDVCTAFFGGSPLLDVHADEIAGRWLGVHALAYDPDGRPVTGTVGEFVVADPMPSMPTRLWDDPDGARLRDAYFELYPGVWRQGDWIRISETGAVVVSGRSDATLNRGGVRLGSAEIYAVVESDPAVADSLVVGVELPDGGYYMPLFVVPAEGAAVDAGLRERLTRTLRAELSPRHVPDAFIAAPVIPRTLTGKKLEVPVKRILQGTAPRAAAAADALDHPEAIDWFAQFARA